MRVSVLLGSAVALLLAGFPAAQGAPVEVIDRRDFSANSGNWYQLQQLMHNIRSRIGVPFSAMRNVGLGYHQILDIDPLDLVLLPNGYCYSCGTAPHTGPDENKRLNPFHNQMVELDETQLLVACTDPDDAQSAEWPLMKACPGQERVLKDFLIDLTSDGSRLAVPKARLENAPVFQLNKHTCMPQDPKRTTCSSVPSSTSASSISQSSDSVMATTSKSNVPDFAASIYSHNIESSTTTKTDAGKLAGNEAVATPITSLPTSTEPETASPPSATLTLQSSTKPFEPPTSTSAKEEIIAAPTSTAPISVKARKLYRYTAVEEEISASPTSAVPASTTSDEPPTSISEKETISAAFASFVSASSR